VVTDLGSTNGVKVNGQRIPPNVPTPLRFGDIIDLVEFRMSLRPWTPGSLPPVAERVRLSPKPQPGIAVYVAGKLLKFPFTKTAITLGRSAENDIVIDHPYVSRYHAQITQSAGGFIIVDKGSANGLTINGQRVMQHQLADGDIITIGGQEVSLQYRASIGLMAAEAPARRAAPVSATGPMSFLNLKGMESIAIGRASDNRIVLDHPQVSRHHALIERMGTRYRIRDLKSSNGVFLNGKRVEREAWLKEGDEIRIGPIKLVLREDGIQQFSEEGLRLDAMRLQKWVTKDKNLLQDISLSILPQEFVALVGMSGSGKSTLMDAINGFRPATHGTVLVNGINLYQNFDLFRNEMGYVPQKDIVHQELTVYSALDYAAQLRMPPDTSPQERHKRITEVLRDLDLTERKDLPIHKLSGGQLKRVSIGVELLTKPRLFFLDEPTSGLDPGTEMEMMKLLRKLADQGRTILLITHATKNVMMCDKVIFLARGGYVAYFGPPEEALPYFDQYRTPQERQIKDIEFDDIYAILNDEKRGSGKDWGERYRQSAQYRQYVVERLEGHKAITPGAQAPRQLPRKRPQAGVLRQFIILSARNLKIMMQDKFGLALMLALAPMIGVMDFIWGTQLFDLRNGDATKIITMLFMAGLIAILVGAMASVREIVKEIDIYKRERAVNLKLTSYILSKIWVGISLSVYQAVVLMFFLYIFVLRTSPLGPVEYLAMLITMFLGTLSGYMMGLLISAAAPNQNVALLLVVAVLVPQFLFSGALLKLEIPGTNIISAGVSTKWAFEAMVNITGIGRDVINDPCWRDYDPDTKFTEEQKEQLGCQCMGARMFETCYYPGLLSGYDEETRLALQQPEPAMPPRPTPYPTFTPVPSPTPYPSPTPPPPPGIFGDTAAYQRQREQQGLEWQRAREKQGQEWQQAREKQGLEYQKLAEKQMQDYQDIQMKDYQKRLEAWKTARTEAIGTAEGKIRGVFKQYGQAFRGGVLERWFAMSVILIVVFGLVIVFQKRKDVV